MSWLEALVLGVVQGLTEFLPVSSSGHLQIGNALFGVSGENLAFTVVVHAATVCSTIIVLRREIAALLKGLFRFSWNPETIYIAKIVVSMIPVAIIGFFFKDYVEGIFGSGLLIVGICLLVTAALLTFAYYARPRVKQDISFRDAFIIGLAQACAVLPGLSRSGSTIATGILLGNNKENIAKFSFLMVLVPVLGEAFLSLVGGDFAAEETGISALALIVGFVSAFVSGSETAYFSLSPADMERIEPNRRARVKSLLEKPERLLATISITNILMNVAVVLLSSYALSQIFVFESVAISFVFQAVVIVFFILLFGELLPKLYAESNKARCASMTVGGLSVLSRCLAPLSGIVAKSTYFVNKVRKQFNLRGIWMLNRIIGSIVVIVSLLGLGFTLMGESLY